MNELVTNSAPVVCPSPFIYQGGPYFGNPPIPTQTFYQPSVTNGVVAPHSPSSKDLSKVRAAAPIAATNGTAGKSPIPSVDMRPPFYPPPQYVDTHLASVVTRTSSNDSQIPFSNNTIIDANRAAPSVAILQPNDPMAMAQQTSYGPIQFTPFPGHFIPGTFPGQHIYPPVLISHPSFGFFYQQGVPSQQVPNSSMAPSMPNNKSFDGVQASSDQPRQDSPKQAGNEDVSVEQRSEEGKMAVANNVEVAAEGVGETNADQVANNVNNGGSAQQNDQTQAAETQQSDSELVSDAVNSTNASSLSDGVSGANVYASGQSSNGGPKSWADLFKDNSSVSYLHNSVMTSSISSTSSSALSPGNNGLANSNLMSADEMPSTFANLNLFSNENDAQLCIPSTTLRVGTRDDPFSWKLARKIRDIQLKHSLPYVIPRGFVNRGNWCYINSVGHVIECVNVVSRALFCPVSLLV